MVIYDYIREKTSFTLRALDETTFGIYQRKTWEFFAAIGVVLWRPCAAKRK